MLTAELRREPRVTVGMGSCGRQLRLSSSAYRLLSQEGETCVLIEVDSAGRTLRITPVSGRAAAVHFYGNRCGQARINVERAFRALGIDNRTGKLAARWNDAEECLEISLSEAVCV